MHASAPGRVNLIGEHTDYNQGFVLPAPLPLRAEVDLARRADRRVVVRSREMAAPDEYVLGEERQRGTWIDYAQGCTAMLREAGHTLGGMELSISSQVPLGSGLSSSAALEVALLRAIRSEFSLALDDVQLALLGQRAENVLVGAPVGAMDQLVASLGVLGSALFIDMQTLATRRIPLPRADLLVINSGIHHDHAAGDYRVRRAECERAARELGVGSLRELTVEDLSRIGKLPAPLDRRTRHVVSENARVLETVTALEAEDLIRVGQLFAASHESMRLDYEVSIPAIDTLVEIARMTASVYGARLTGGGFGGSIVALAERGAGPEAARQIAMQYQTRTRHIPTVLLAGEVTCEPS
jgi:galactokinase